MSTGELDLNSNFVLSESDVAQIPAIAYGVPDIDATVKVFFNSKADNRQLALLLK